MGWDITSQQLLYCVIVQAILIVLGVVVQYLRRLQFHIESARFAPPLPLPRVMKTLEFWALINFLQFIFSLYVIAIHVTSLYLLYTPQEAVHILLAACIFFVVRWLLDAWQGNFTFDYFFSTETLVEVFTIVPVVMQYIRPTILLFSFVRCLKLTRSWELILPVVERVLAPLTTQATGAAIKAMSLVREEKMKGFRVLGSFGGFEDL